MVSLRFLWICIWNVFPNHHRITIDSMFQARSLWNDLVKEGTAQHGGSCQSVRRDEFETILGLWTQWTHLKWAFFAIPLQQGEHELKYEQAPSLILGVTCMTSRSQVGWELWIDQLPGFVGILQGTRGTCVEPARLGCFDAFNLILDGGGRVLIPCCQGVQGLKRSCTTGAWPSSSLLGWIGWMFSRFCSVSLHYGSWVYFLYNIRNMQYAIYLDIDLFTFLRCVSSRRPLEEIPLKAAKDSGQKSLETTLGSDLVPSMPDWTSGGLAVWIGWRVTGEEESWVVGADSGLKYVEDSGQSERPIKEVFQDTASTTKCATQAPEYPEV